jgi:hypothetical protein
MHSQLCEGPQNDEMQRTRPGFARSLAAELSILRTSGPNRVAPVGVNLALLALAAFLTTACTDAATRLANDIQDAATALCNGPQTARRLIHQPSRRPEGCDGAYEVTFQQSLRHPGGSLLVGCVGSSNYNTLGYSYSTTYHLNFVRVPRELHAKKSPAAPVIVVLESAQDRSAGCVVEVVDLQ